MQKDLLKHLLTFIVCIAAVRVYDLYDRPPESQIQNQYSNWLKNKLSKSNLEYFDICQNTPSLKLELSSLELPPKDATRIDSNGVFTFKAQDPKNCRKLVRLLELIDSGKILSNGVTEKSNSSAKLEILENDKLVFSTNIPKYLVESTPQVQLLFKLVAEYSSEQAR